MHLRLPIRSLLAASIVVSTLPLLAAESAPQPEHTITGNVGLFSQYIFRGLTQTNENPALQGGFDYAHMSGLYAGVWGSNISWISDFGLGSSSLEMDFYGGYKPTFGDFFVDVGALRYQYWGDYNSGVTKPNTTELYLAGGWKTISLKYSYSTGDTFGVCDAKGTSYLDFTASWPIGDFSILGHYGQQKYKGNCNNQLDNNDARASYKDWKIEGAWTFAKDWSLGVGYTSTDADDTDIKKANYSFNEPGRDPTAPIPNKFIGDGMGYFYVKKTF